MKKELLDLIQEKAPGAIPLLLVIRGSHAYGTSLPTSDTDFAGVYIQSISDILGFGYKEQINDDKNDTVFYELKRFLELVKSNNPNILELLNTPTDCIIHKHPVFDSILLHKDLFITKTCAKSFAGYAVQQIKKAKGQDKKQNWSKEKITRKDVLDFCYVVEGEKTIPWKIWTKKERGISAFKYEDKFCGVVNVPNARDVFAVYYDANSHFCFSNTISEESRKINIEKSKVSGKIGLGYRGIVKVSESDISEHHLPNESNQLRLSSIPKGEYPICNIVYNQDAYRSHCDEFKSYQTWLENKNEQRWIDVKSHGQKIDGKNMMHCRRLLEMAREIAEGKGINVRRKNSDYLISIRKGEVDLQTLIDNAENDIKEIDNLFKESNLPDSVNTDLVNKLLIDIRNQIYKL